MDTRAITRRLRDTGALNGIITTDMTTAAEELVQQTKSWSILGKDLISEVTCSEPYEWKDTTEHEWEFNPNVLARNGEQPFHVSTTFSKHTAPPSHWCQILHLDTHTFLQHLEKAVVLLSA